MTKKVLHLIYPLIALLLLSTIDTNAQTYEQMKKKFRHAMTQDRNSSGREFFVAFPYNDDKQQLGQNLAIYVTSSVDTRATIYNASLGINETKIVPAHEIVEFSSVKGGIGWDVEVYDKEKKVDAGLRITSPDPIAVYCMNSKSVTAEGYLAIPTNYWGTDYIHNSYFDFDEVREWAGGFLILAKEKNTNVVIHIRDGYNKTRGFGKTAKGRQHGDVIPVTLNEGEVFMVQGDGKTIAQFDLSGSLITSDKPIGLISYHNRTTIPQSGSNNGRDHLIEMPPPVTAWGTEYATVEYDRGSDKGDYFRVVAGEDNVTFYADWYEKAGGGNNKKIGSFGPIKLLEKGDWFEFDNTPVVAPHSLESIRGVSRFKADGKIQVMQYSYSANYDNASAYDPFMILVTAVEQYTKETTFQTPANYGTNEYKDNFFNIIAIGDTADPVRHLELLSSITIDDQRVVDIQPAFSGARIPGTNLYWAFITSLQQGTHKLKGNTPFGGYIYGYANFDSYGWPAATAFGNLSEIDTLPPIVTFPPGCFEWLVKNVDDPKHERNGKEGDNPRQIDVGVSVLPTLQPGSFNFDEPIAVDKDGNEIEWNSFNPNYEFYYKVKVTNPYENAQANLRVIDDVGNFTDTTIIYNVDKITSNPDPIVFGRVRVKSAKTLDVVISSQSPDEVEITDIKLSQNKTYKILTDLSFLPFTMAPLGDTTLTLEYIPVDEYPDLNTDPVLQFDFDTLVVTTGCLEWKYSINGQGVQPEIKVQDYNAGFAKVGNTTTTKNSGQPYLYIQNFGTDTLIVTGVKYVKAPFSVLLGAPDANDEIIFDKPIKVAPGGVATEAHFGHDLDANYLITFAPFSAVDTDNSIDVQFLSNAADEDKDDISRWYGVATASGPLVVGANYIDTRVDGKSGIKYATVTNLLPPGTNHPSTGTPLDVKTSTIKIESADGTYELAPNAKIRGLNTKGDVIRPDLNNTVSTTLYPELTPDNDKVTLIEIPIIFTPTARGTQNNRVVVEFVQKDVGDNGILYGNLSGKGFIPEVKVSNMIFKDESKINSGLNPEKGRTFITNVTNQVDGEYSDLLIRSIEIDQTSPAKAQFINPVLESTGQPIDQVKDLVLPLGEVLTVTYDFTSDGGKVGQQFARLKVLTDAGPANADGSDPIADNKYDVTFDGNYVDISQNQSAKDDGGYIQAGIYSTGIEADDVPFGSVSFCGPPTLTTNIRNLGDGVDAKDEIISNIIFVGTDPAQDVFEFSNFVGKVIPISGNIDVNVKFVYGTAVGTYKGDYQVVCESGETANFTVDGSITSDVFKFELEEYRLTPGDVFGMNVRMTPEPGSSFKNAQIEEMIVSIRYKPEWLAYQKEATTGIIPGWQIELLSDKETIIAGETWKVIRFSLSGNGSVIPDNPGGILFSPKFMYLLHQVPEENKGKSRIEPEIHEVTFGNRRDCNDAILGKGAILSEFCVQNYRALDLVFLGENPLEPVSPNPVIGTMNLQFTVSSESLVKLGLTNLDGVVVKELANTRMNAGEYNVNVDVSDIPTGTYFLTFEYLGVKENQKIVITK
ncbi:MAG: T9SS type A sorting domain-containing protein [Ignavibacteriae bacterium]|nr:T9SS type A sorting domain-containing protein [Ignavibacteriota bacterium]